MLDNSFYNSKTAKIDSKCTNIPVLICSPLTAPETFVGVLCYQCTVFIIFNIPIQYQNNYYDRIKTEIFNFQFFSTCQITTSGGL